MLAITGFRVELENEPLCKKNEDGKHKALRRPRWSSGDRARY
jgi:hypothetical protein